MRDQLKWNTIMVFLAGLLFDATMLHASLPQLWPTFSEPSTIVNVGFSGQAGADLMPVITFQGAYNQASDQQGLGTRLYFDYSGGVPGSASYWLNHAVPSGVTVSNLSYNTGDADGTLKALLSTYGSKIKGYYICDPYNAPETCNMAMTLAGINDAMVVEPDNLAIMQNSTYNPSVPLMANGDLRTYIWIGSSSSLVNNTTENMISNPSGGSGTTGWSVSGGTVSTGTGSGSCGGQGQTLKYTSTSANTWAFYDPAIPSNRIGTTPYIFSVQACVQSGSPVFLDAWNGCGDVQSSPISSGSGWQTLQLAVPLPLSGCVGNTTIKLEMRTSGSNGTTVFFHNAAVIDNRIAIDTYQFNNFASQTNGAVLVADFANAYAFRDYQIAAKLFTFDLGSKNSDESQLLTTILTNTSPGKLRAHNTPVMGWVDDETNDVQNVSAHGLWINAADNYFNGSIWASMPQPSSLSQPGPTAPFKTNNGTVYVALAASDGDNTSIIEQQDVSRWTNSQFLGAVPTGWTMSPGMIDFAPGIISNFYVRLPQSQELMTGPSGIGYETGETGSDLSQFASLTNQFMTAENMSTAENWSQSTSDLTTFADDVNVPHVLHQNPYPYTRESNSAQTVLDGQDVFYFHTPAAQLSKIEGAINSNYSSTNPTYIEVLENNLTLSPDDTLYIAQSLQARYSYPIVFMTPSEMAAAEPGGGTVTGSPQAVLGSILQSAFPQNLIWNANGQEPARGMNSTNWAIGGTGHNEALYFNQDFLGTGTSMFHVPANAGATCYVYEYFAVDTTDPDPEIVVGDYYLFSVNVAGTGSVYVNVFDGTSNNNSATVALSPTSWTNISMIVQLKSATAGQIQILVPQSSSTQTVYFSGPGRMQPGWYYGTGQTSGNVAGSLGTTVYNSAQGYAQAFSLHNPANSGTQWVNFYPAGLASGTTYVASVDVAGTGEAYLAFYNGSEGTDSSTVTLNSSWQTLTVSAAASGSNPPRFQIVTPTSSSDTTIYFRNASLTPAPRGSPLFASGIETGQTQLAATNTVDQITGAGGQSNVSNWILDTSNTASHGGTYSVQYGGTANGGSATHAYMEAFTSGNTLSSTSRLSYWIYPMSPQGWETDASSMTGLNSTCVAIDIVFTDGTALRNLGVKDQFSNTLNPSSECTHLQPDQWNYVTANLSSLSGKTVYHIDVGYDQPGATGNYGGYIDDITLSH